MASKVPWQISWVASREIVVKLSVQISKNIEICFLIFVGRFLLMTYLRLNHENAFEIVFFSTKNEMENLKETLNTQNT